MKADGPPKVTYWAGRGRCEPLRCILAAANILHIDNFLTLETGRSTLFDLRAAGILAYDQVPLVEFEGRNLVQAASAARFLGRRLGMLPSDPDDAYLVESIWDSVNDARAPLVSFPFMAYPQAPGVTEKEQTLAMLAGPKGLVGRYAGKWEHLLTARVGPYFLGDTASIADIGCFEVCDYFRDVFGVEQYEASFAAYPRLMALVTAVKQLGRLAEHCDVSRRKYDTWDETTGSHANWGVYAKAVRTTLA